MKHIHLNLKRFDVLPELGGVNRLAEPQKWAQTIIKAVEPRLSKIKQAMPDTEFTLYFPELHLLPALASQEDKEVLTVGCQSVYRSDTSIGGNFGAFTGRRTANSMAQVGVGATIIGHLEERVAKNEILAISGITDTRVEDTIYNHEIKCALASGLKVLYCVGETLAQRSQWKEVLEKQLRHGLLGVDPKQVIVAYEPVWAIGPGKEPPTAEQVAEVVLFIKSLFPDVSVIYGGGLKHDNAYDLSQIDALDGGLIALTRFSGDIGFYPDEYIEIIQRFLHLEGLE